MGIVRTGAQHCPYIICGGTSIGAWRIERSEPGPTGRCGVGARLLLKDGFGGFGEGGGEVALEDRDDFGFVDGLGDVVVHAGFDAAFAIGLHGVGGHGDDDGVAAGRFGAADLFGGLVAVHDGHLAIHENEVVAIGGDHIDGFLAVGGEFDGKTEALQHPRRDELVDGVVFDEE